MFEAGNQACQNKITKSARTAIGPSVCEANNSEVEMHKVKAEL
jgi:hypothetical protein